MQKSAKTLHMPSNRYLGCGKCFASGVMYYCAGVHKTGRCCLAPFWVTGIQIPGLKEAKRTERNVFLHCP